MLCKGLLTAEFKTVEVSTEVWRLEETEPRNYRHYAGAMSALGVSSGGGGDTSIGRRASPRTEQQLYRPPGRRRAAAETPEPATSEQRRPPRQLYIPPRGRRPGTNRASSPGFSTCSEIIGSWRTAPDAGPARPPPGPRRRISHQTRQHVERLAEASAGLEDGYSAAPVGGSPQQGSPSDTSSPGKRSGRRRRRGGRRSRSSSEDRTAATTGAAAAVAASAAGAVSPDRGPSFQVPTFPLSPTATAPRPAHVPWRANAATGRFTPTPEREVTRPAARPRFQQPYQPPALRERPASAAAELPPSPRRQSRGGPDSSPQSPRYAPRDSPRDSPQRRAADSRPSPGDARWSRETVPVARDGGSPRSPLTWRRRTAEHAGQRTSPASAAASYTTPPSRPGRERERTPSESATPVAPAAAVVLDRPDPAPAPTAEGETGGLAALPVSGYDLLVNTTDDEKATLSARRVPSSAAQTANDGSPRLASPRLAECAGVSPSPASVVREDSAGLATPRVGTIPTTSPPLVHHTPAVATTESISEEASPSTDRRRSSVSSGGAVYESFDWAEEMEQQEWEKNYTDEGEPTADKVSPPAPSRRPVIDYLSWRPPSSPAADQPEDSDSEDPALPSHVLELYDFPASFTTQDLTVVYQEFGARGFDVRWVDDTHALAVFSSAQCVAEALLKQHPLVRSRPLSQASPKARQKAARCQKTSDLQPHRPRPETCALQARRMVFSALGRRDSAPREQREQERKQLQTARDKKRLAAKQKQDAWEGNFS